MEILNIDQLAQVRRKLRMDGADHEVQETSVQAFINNLKAAEELEASSKKPKAPKKLSEEVENALQSIIESVPTLNVESLRKKPHFVLVEILRFIRGELDPEVKQAAADAVNGTAVEGGDQKKT